MESGQTDRVTAFDALFTNNHIQMLKLLLGYLDPSVHGRLAVYIKFLELQYTLRFFQNHPAASISACSGVERPCGGMGQLLEEISPLCSPAEKEKLQNLQNMYRNFENMQEMMQMLEMLQEISPELFSGGAMPGFGNSDGSGDAQNFMNILSNIGDVDLTQMSEMLQGMFRA